MIRVLSSTYWFQFYANLPVQSLRDAPMGIEIVKQMITDAFITVDREMLNEEYESRWVVTDHRNRRKRLDTSGSTCCGVFITPQHIICANAGDTRACYFTQGKAVPLSCDHKPHKASEKRRIEAAGGYVSMKRVDGDLAVSRGLGDFRYKEDVSLPPNLQKVSCIPDFVVCDRDLIHDEFLIIGCDGIFDVMSCDEICQAVQNIFNEGETDLGIAAEEILDLCLEKDSKDNLSLILVAFPGVKISENGGGGVEARRAIRRAKVEEERRIHDARAKAKAELKREASIKRKQLLERAKREEEESESDIGM
jgi:serine/threonine protein phosphatase PrpC